MRTYLIYTDVNSIHGVNYHPGLASLSAVLLKNGHEVKIGCFNKLNDSDNIIKEIIGFHPDLVGFTAVETQFAYIKSLALEIRKIFQGLMICGGPYATFSPDAILGDENIFDAAVIGEGEIAITQIAEKINKIDNWHSANNLVYRDSQTSTIIKNPLNPIIEQLDLLPYPNTELFPYQRIINEKNVLVFHFNRGCPYKCSYCSNRALGEIYGKSFNSIRYRSVKSAIDEIDNTLSKYKLRDDTMLQFLDDLFIFNKEWLREFSSIYKKKINRPFWCTGRSNHINDEVCSLLKSAGCKLLMMSVESGNDYIRNDIMHRNISRETLFNSFELCHKYGLKTLATCIIGLPFETKSTIEDSIKTVSKLKSIKLYGINIFYPYKGTQLRNLCEANGFISTESDHSNFTERKSSILKLSDLTNEDLQYYYNNWEKLIMKQKGLGNSFKYAIKKNLMIFRKSFFGNWITQFLRFLRAEKIFKKLVYKYF